MNVKEAIELRRHHERAIMEAIKNAINDLSDTGLVVKAIDLEYAAAPNQQIYPVLVRIEASV